MFLNVTVRMGNLQAVQLYFQEAWILVLNIAFNFFYINA